MTDKKNNKNAVLMLEDGTVFLGKGIGKKGEAVGEVCFNTSITGYQEILTDPSYYKQIICFTFPHIGNVGTNKFDYESEKPYATGLIVGAEVTEASNYRNEENFLNWLESNNITGISQVDTRHLTAHIRDKGAQNVIIAFADSVSDIDFSKLKEKLEKVPSMKGMELAKEVTTDHDYDWNQGIWNFEAGNYNDKSKNIFNIVAIDFGVKKNILRNLSEAGCNVKVVPADTNAEDIIKLNPDGVFLSNGPGDPAETAKYATETIKKIVDADIPLFGICLGHQILASALGCKTIKMEQGHRGANHPVKNLATERVEISSQNHGFAVTREGIPNNVKETHISLFDNTNEGIRLEGKDVFSVQHHPEASPGPVDSAYIFTEFFKVLEKRKQNKAA
jgi:carbamoyl-phosphate synthase small subunit